MENANRTCNLILGVGDGKNEIFNSVRYSHSGKFYIVHQGFGSLVSSVRRYLLYRPFHFFIKILVADFFDDKNMEPGPVCTQPQPCDWHPRIDSVVYHGMDWNCPTYTERLGEEIQKYWGQITPELVISDIIAKVCADDEAQRTGLRD